MITQTLDNNFCASPCGIIVSLNKHRADEVSVTRPIGPSDSCTVPVLRRLARSAVPLLSIERLKLGRLTAIDVLKQITRGGSDRYGQHVREDRHRKSEEDR